MEDTYGVLSLMVIVWEGAALNIYGRQGFRYARKVDWLTGWKRFGV